MSEDRNLSPHAEAIAAMYIWGERYSRQSVDFYDNLTRSEKDVCQELVKRIRIAPEAA